MFNSYQTKKILVISLIILIVGASLLTIKLKKEPIVVVVENPVNEVAFVPTTPTVKLCYYRSDMTDSGYSDVAWLKLNTVGDKVTGEFSHLPAESDSKTGDFSGTIDSSNKQSSTIKKSTVWWNSSAEGMEVKEELVIKWDDKSASAGFGEMIDKGDGTYVYKNKDNLNYIKAMDIIDCNNLDEKVFVEKYIRDNIGTIATDKPVLGGTWYVTTVAADPTTHTALVTYEDGHIQSKATITYAYQQNPEKIVITKIEAKK